MTTIYARPSAGSAQGWLSYEKTNETPTTVVFTFSMGLKVDNGSTTGYEWDTVSYSSWHGTGGTVDKEITYAKGKSGEITGATWSTTFTRTNSSQTLTRCLECNRYKSSSNVDTAYTDYTITIDPIPNTYTITYDAAGGSGAPSSQTYYGGYQTTVPSATVVKAHYTFLNWLDNRGKIYEAGDSVPNEAGIFANLTLTAQYKFAQSIVYVTYNGNGYSGAPAMAPVPDDESHPGRYDWTSGSMSDQEKHKFSGWSTSSSSSTAQYTPNTTYYIYNSMTVYAVWTYIEQSYTITYNPMGGSNAPLTQTWACVNEYSNSVTLSSTTPTKAGFVFQGWATTSNASTYQYTAGQTITLGDSDGSFTLYAIWAADSSYTYVQGNTVNSQWSTFMLYKYTTGDDTVTIDVKTGLYVSGTQTTTDFTNNGSGYDNEEGTSTTWNNRLSAVVRLSGTKVVMTEQTLTYNRRTTAYNVSLSSSLYAGSASSTTSTVAATIPVANIRAYEVAYNANGGSSAPASQYKGHGYALTITSQIPVRPSYRFLGWATSAESSTVAYVGGDSYTIDAPIELFAVWTYAYYESTVSGLSNVSDVCDWHNDTIAAISGNSIYQVDVGGNLVGPFTIQSYTGTPKLCYSNGQLIVMTNEYVAFISDIDSSITYTSYDIDSGASTVYGFFGATSTDGVGSLTVPSR